MTYEKQTWNNDDPTTPLNANRLNHIEAGISQATGNVVENAVSEWWITPRSINDPDNTRIVGGDVSAETGGGQADIVVWERLDSGQTNRYAIAKVATDDHNVPAVLRLPWGGLLVAWNNHNRDRVWRWKVSNRGGDLASLVAVQEQTFNAGFDISYAQLHLIEHLSTPTSATVWALVRLYRGDGWAWEFLTMTISPDGTTTVSSPRRFLSGGTDQAYAASVSAHATGEQVIRVAFGYNPAAARSEVHAFEVNAVTGAVTSLSDPSVASNVVTPSAVPIVAATKIPLIPALPSGQSRRLYYPRPGPSRWAVAYSDWTISDPDNARYKVMEYLGGTSGGNINSGSFRTAITNDTTASGFTLDLIGVRLGVTSIPADRELARRWVSSTDRQVQVRITSGGILKVNLTREGNNAADFLSTVAVPGLFTDEVSLRIVVAPSTSGGTMTFYTSPDRGASWTQLGAVLNISTYATVATTTAPLVVGTPVPALSVPFIIQRATYRDVNALVAGLDFATAPVGQSTVPGMNGETWEVVGDATITRSQMTYDLGVAGPRVGYTPLANYNGGLAFTDPSENDSVVLVARRGTDTSTLERWVRTSAGFQHGETLAQSEHYLARPDSPVGGARGLRGMWTEITAYSSTNYADYQGNRQFA